MAGPPISLSSKQQRISQQDFDIVITCMDHLDTSLPPHPMISSASTLLHLVFSVTPSSLTHFTLSLPH